jgi:hypothetical protein
MPVQSNISKIISTTLVNYVWMDLTFPTTPDEPIIPRRQKAASSIESSQD